MLRIRFLRTGKKNQPFFRMVVCDKKNPPRGGRFLEIVGSFNPQTKETQLKPERIKHWLSKGAQPSDRAHNLLVSQGIIKAAKKPVHSKPKKKEETIPSTPDQEKTAQSEPPKEQPAPEKPGKPKEPKQIDKEEKKETK